MRVTPIAAMLAFGTLLHGCGDHTTPVESAAPTSVAPAAAPAQARSMPNQLPALYSGVLPCADCPGIRYSLDLRADSVYFLSMKYLDTEPLVVRYEIGQWTISDDNVLVLHGPGDKPDQFAVQDADTLRKLDMAGQPLPTQFNVSLRRRQDYAPIEPRLTMRGMYQHTADGATFSECLTGLTLPVADESDGAALQEMYLKTRKEPGQSVLASLDGQLVRRATSDGSPRDTLIVTHADRFWPNESCGARGVSHELESTRWVLVRLGDEVVMPTPGAREPYIALEPTEHRISGHGGCNRLVGGYELNGTWLRFTQLALTRMACMDAKYEDRFAQALNATAGWHIDGNHLELLAADGVPVARFEERNL